MSADGTLAACATGKQARVWDAETGRIRGTFDLPPGREDALAFHPNGGLYLTRCELVGGQDFPIPSVDRKSYPRVIRVRNLLGPKPLDPVREIPMGDWDIHLIRMPPDAGYVVASMHRERPENGQRLVTFNPAGQEPPENLLSREGFKPRFNVLIDPTGKVLSYVDPADELARPLFLEMPARKPLHLHAQLGVPGPRFERWVMPSNVPPYHCTLYELGREAPLVRLGGSAPPSSFRFSPDGHLFAWATPEHQIIVADLRRMREELTKDGLGW